MWYLLLVKTKIIRFILKDLLKLNIQCRFDWPYWTLYSSSWTFSNFMWTIIIGWYCTFKAIVCSYEGQPNYVRWDLTLWWLTSIIEFSIFHPTWQGIWICYVNFKNWELFQKWSKYLFYFHRWPHYPVKSWRPKFGWKLWRSRIWGNDMTSCFSHS